MTSTPSPSAWVQDKLTTGVTHDLAVVDLDGAKVTDTDMTALEGVQGLAKALSQWDADHRPRDGLTRRTLGLEVLEPAKTSISDVGLAHVTGMGKLSRALSLRHSCR